MASFAVAAVRNPAAHNRRLALGGPEALSFCDAVGVYEQVLGRTVPVRHIAPGEPVPGLPAYVADLAASFDTYDSPVDMAATARTFGVELTPLETYVRQNSDTSVPSVQRFSEKSGILD